MAIRIILADDHKIVRESFRALLSKNPKFEIVADVGDGESAVSTTLELHPDIVVMDMSMPIVSGEEATRQILSILPDTRIIALSMHTHPRVIAAMLRAGAKAFIPKTSKAAELITAIQAVTRGETYIAAGLEAPPDIEALSPESPPPDILPSALSQREHQLLSLLADGCDSQKIADKLKISVKTVSSHRKNTMKKLNIYTVAGLTKYAIREGISSI